MSEGERPRVLVPVKVLEEVREPDATTQMVSAVDVVLLGYHKVPEQTPPGQMEMEYGDEATEHLEALADTYRETGATVTEHLVFTPDPAQTFARISNEEECNAILLPRPSETMERLLVPIRGETNLPRLMHVTARLLEGNQMEVTFLHVTDDEADVDAGELLLRGAREQLAEHGVDPDRVTLNVGAAENSLDAVIQAAQSFDGLVLGESDPSLRDIVIGEAHERIAEGYPGPILIVRRTLDGDAPSIPEESG